MKLLLIDTCGASGSIALAAGGEILAEEQLPGRSSSERLIPAVRAALGSLGWRLDGLAAIVIVHGPGSFTGLRVGLSAVKGLSEASGVPLIAISRLAVLAAGGRAALDAGRGELYVGDYTAGKALEALTAAAALAAWHGLRVCEQRVADSLQGVAEVVLVAEPTAAAALGLALASLQAGSFDDAATLDANYLRRSDAQLFARPTHPVAD